jgi:Arc/MetJ-type ribon-helix-helix transcriptional regulator
METLTLNLPPEMKALIEEEAAENGYKSPSDYVAAVVIEHVQRKSKVALDPILQDPANRKRIEGLLLEALDSEPSEMSQHDWDELKRRVWEVHAKRPGA